MTRILLYIAGGLLVLALLALGWQTHSLGKAQNRAVAAETRAEEYKGSLESLQAAHGALLKSAQAEREALAKRARVAEDHKLKAKKESRDVQEALDTNRDWASQPLPDGVRDALAN